VTIGTAGRKVRWRNEAARTAKKLAQATGPAGAEKLSRRDFGADLNRNPNYFKSDKAWFDCVECLSIKDVTARTNALATAEIDHMDRCDLKTLDLLKANPNLVIQETPGYGHAVADAAFSGAVDTTLLWEEQAKAAGLNLNVVREPDDGCWDNVWLKKPFCASYWSGRPTRDWMFATAYAAEAAWNETHWKNPRFNELLVAARSETDDAKRAGMYAEMQQLVHDDGGLVNPVFNTYVDGHINTLAHGDVAANWPMDGQKIAERWWFAS
jgi:ABC-type transport system substrate-binding protein